MVMQRACRPGELNIVGLERRLGERLQLRQLALYVVELL